jgi:hypothetical protein
MIVCQHEVDTNDEDFGPYQFSVILENTTIVEEETLFRQFMLNECIDNEEEALALAILRGLGG